MSSPDIAELRLHQTLHGYERGHRLLASSLKMSIESERRMRLKSDFTGSSYKNGFDSYLSAYSLPMEASVAFARTWYAKEMPRPGCVWTHSLVVPLKLLVSIKHVGLLLRCFQKPHGSSYRNYEQELVVENESYYPRLPFSTEHIANLMDGLYGAPSKPVFLLSDASQQYEDLILSLWSQQWPALRQEFSICTGLLELRGPEHLSDLQVIPKSDKKLKREAADSGFVLDLEHSATSVQESWASLGARDITAGPTHAFREFLHCFCDDDQKGRENYRKLANIFLLLDRDEPSPVAAVNEVASAFPSQDDARQLKKLLFGEPNVRQFFSDIKDIAVLEALADADSSALSPASLRLKHRYRVAWQDEPTAAMSLLEKAANKPTNRLYDYILESAAGCLDEHTIGTVATRNCDAAFALVRHNIRLASSKDVWSCQSCSIDSLAQEFRDQVSRDPLFSSAVLGAQILANRSDQVERMAAILSDEIVPSLLNAGPEIALHVDNSQVQVWERILTKYEHACLQWLQNRRGNSDASDMVAGLGLAVGRQGAASRVIPYWRRLYAGNDGISMGTRVHAAVVVLAAAFDEGGHDAELSCRVVFPFVYEAASSGHISEIDWHGLLTRLPSGGPSWDRCKMLRGGLIEQCVRHKWSHQTVVDCTRLDDLLGQILQAWGWDRDEKRLLRNVAHNVSNGLSSPTANQVQAAKQYLSSLWF